jgi:hypothetical protein
MARAIKPATLRLLRWLDERADKIRKESGLHQRGAAVAWQMSETDPGRFFEVVADGYGRFVLVDYRGINPNDREFLHEAEYGDEETAWFAVLRLGQYGVSWAERDAATGEPGDEETPDRDPESALPARDVSPGA